MSASDITALLELASAGDVEAQERLFPVVYEELRLLASQRLRRERRGHTLQTTALVHEAFLRLVDPERAQWESRAHFFGAAANAMRQVLVNHARDRGRLKRGGDRRRLELADALAAVTVDDRDLVALDDALASLAAVDARKVRIVELRYFGGLSVEEAAACLDVSPSTVKREWAAAKTWLLREIRKGDQG